MAGNFAPIVVPKITNLLTRSALAIRNSLDELILLVPFSHFCTCWQLNPIARASSSWVTYMSLRKPSNLLSDINVDKIHS